MLKSVSHPTGMWVVLILLAISVVVLYLFMEKRAPSLQFLSPSKTKASREVQVWAVKRTGLYHCPGSKLYGKGESGLLMTQEKAMAGGYRAANGEACR